MLTALIIFGTAGIASAVLGKLHYTRQDRQEQERRNQLYKQRFIEKYREYGEGM